MAAPDPIAPDRETRYSYVGSELALFAEARHWKAYLRRQVAPLLGPEVLEVGAGIGATTRALHPGSATRWVCLEPDGAMAARLRDEATAGDLPRGVEVREGTTGDLLGDRPAPFDAVLYIDVLEHIDDDRGELERAAALLRPGGRLVVVAPAHPWLFSPFDEALGHHRRYTRGSLRRVAPGGLELLRLRSLDSLGLLASLGNRLLTRQSRPTRAQIRFWDGALVRPSTLVDRPLGYRVGRTLLGAWRAPTGRRGPDR